LKRKEKKRKENKRKEKQSKVKQSITKHHTKTDSIWLGGVVEQRIMRWLII
jgi:hypothetical protein